ncbi:MAG TPA: tRNA preQ1(34) S-adenosylmethionine ribosyltransferase-isomerase QueA, partial [Burkholderiales bacterium]|nr:tRNA preQ1(34) S-adenosylmethionine ribosyltransferase-isomerase QueA [Burkholderiales bacterium]
SDFDFELPPELIAQFPPAERTASRLLVPRTDGEVTQMRDLHFRDLPQLLSPGDLLVFNQTRVVKARLFGEKDSGGKIELLIERVLDAHTALAHIRASKSPKPGSRLNIAGAEATVKEKRDALYLLRFSGPATVFEIMDAHGAVPLPPYIEHSASAQDIERYQTVYARTPGAVAAPTAGLHFDQALLDTLRAQGVHTAFLTLHVGAGTFQPVRGEKIEEHVMHSECYDITPETVAAITSAKQRGSKVIAVGTTSVRALESAALRADSNANPGELLAAGAAETQIFIMPGFKYKVVDRLITNFHLPKSTLLMLVSAFAGHDLMLKLYAHAIEERYRFFSYGDAMLLDRPG